MRSMRKHLRQRTFSDWIWMSFKFHLVLCKKEHNLSRVPFFDCFYLTPTSAAQPQPAGTDPQPDNSNTRQSGPDNIADHERSGHARPASNALSAATCRAALQCLLRCAP